MAEEQLEFQTKQASQPQSLNGTDAELSIYLPHTITAKHSKTPSAAKKQAQCAGLWVKHSYMTAFLLLLLLHIQELCSKYRRMTRCSINQKSENVFLFYILPCNTWRRCLCYSGRTLQQGRELSLVLLAHTSNSYSCPSGSLVTRVPYLEVVIQDPGILYCSVLFVTKHCHVQEGLAAHAVNRKKPESGPVPTAAGSPAIHHVGWGQAPISLSANSRDLRISPLS